MEASTEDKFKLCSKFWPNYFEINYGFISVKAFF